MVVPGGGNRNRSQEFYAGSAGARRGRVLRGATERSGAGEHHVGPMGVTCESDVSPTWVRCDPEVRRARVRDGRNVGKERAAGAGRARARRLGSARDKARSEWTGDRAEPAM